MPVTHRDVRVIVVLPGKGRRRENVSLAQISSFAT